MVAVGGSPGQATADSFDCEQSVLVLLRSWLCLTHAGDYVGNYVYSLGQSSEGRMVVVLVVLPTAAAVVWVIPPFPIVGGARLTGDAACCVVRNHKMAQTGAQSSRRDALGLPEGGIADGCGYICKGFESGGYQGRLQRAVCP